MPKKEVVEWDELELGETLSPSNDNYYEKAQSFKDKLKEMRIKYLGLRPKLRKDEAGNVFRVYVKDARALTGINERGVLENIQFLEDRLSHHTVLTSWNEARMMQVMKDDMETWFYYLMRNRENWEIEKQTALALRSTINDILEVAYRRGIEDKERGSMTPTVSILEKLGLLKSRDQNLIAPSDQLKQEMQKI